MNKLNLKPLKWYYNSNTYLLPFPKLDVKICLYTKNISSENPVKFIIMEESDQDGKIFLMTYEDSFFLFFLWCWQCLYFLLRLRLSISFLRFNLLIFDIFLLSLILYFILIYILLMP